MNDTPRTNAVIEPLVAGPIDWDIVAEKMTDFARQLERELNKALAELEQIKDERFDQCIERDLNT